MRNHRAQPILQTHDLIIGAGLAGLAYSQFTDQSNIILERSQEVGGVAKSRLIDGFTFDCTGHWLHLNDPEMATWIKGLFPEGFLEVNRRAEVHIAGVRTPYPFQANTHGLPTSIIADCVLGYFEAREAGLRGEHSPPRSFEDFIRQRMGDGIAKHFMIPYNTKMWTVPPSEMSHQWCGRFVPLPSPEEVILGAITKAGADRPVGYNSSFFYPKEKGIGELPRRISGALNERLKLESAVERVNWQEKIAHTSKGDAFEYKRLISTMPLPNLIDSLENTPEAIRDARRLLRCTTVTYWNVGVAGSGADNAPHWIYFPDKEIPFYRAGSPSAAIPSTAPKDHRSHYVEVSHPSEAPCPVSDDELIAGLRDVNLLGPNEEPCLLESHSIPCAYVIMDSEYGRARETLMTWLNQQHIYSVGRYGAWTYDSMEGAMVQGRDLARKLNEPGAI